MFESGRCPRCGAMALSAACRGRQVVGVLAARGGAIMAGVATAGRNAAVIESGRCPRCGAMALIAACRGRQVVGVLAGRGGAIMAGVATAGRNAAVIESGRCPRCGARSEEHTSELQSLMRISYAVFCLKKKQ